MTPHPRGSCRAAAVASVCVVALAAAGCSRVDATGGNGFVTAERSVLVIPAAQRGDPVTGVSGTTVDGEPFDLATDGARGETVVNVWGSWCSPCRSEAPALVEAHAQLVDDDVTFLGIDVKDTPAAALAFARHFGVTWPSLDDPEGRTVLAFRQLGSQAIPTTWVLDDQDRIAARIVDQVDSATLVGVVADVRAGNVSSGTGSDG